MLPISVLMMALTLPASHAFPYKNPTNTSPKISDFTTGTISNIFYPFGEPQKISRRSKLQPEFQPYFENYRPRPRIEPIKYNAARRKYRQYITSDMLRSKPNRRHQRKRSKQDSYLPVFSDDQNQKRFDPTLETSKDWDSNKVQRNKNGKQTSETETRGQFYDENKEYEPSELQKEKTKNENSNTDQDPESDESYVLEPHEKDDSIIKPFPITESNDKFFHRSKLDNTKFVPSPPIEPTAETYITQPRTTPTDYLPVHEREDDKFDQTIRIDNHRDEKDVYTYKTDRPSDISYFLPPDTGFKHDILPSSSIVDAPSQNDYFIPRKDAEQKFTDENIEQIYQKDMQNLELSKTSNNFKNFNQNQHYPLPPLNKFSKEGDFLPIMDSKDIEGVPQSEVKKSASDYDTKNINTMGLGLVQIYTQPEKGKDEFYLPPEETQILNEFSPLPNENRQVTNNHFPINNINYNVNQENERKVSENTMNFQIPEKPQDNYSKEFPLSIVETIKTAALNRNDNLNSNYHTTENDKKEHTNEKVETYFSNEKPDYKEISHENNFKKLSFKTPRQNNLEQTALDGENDYSKNPFISYIFHSNNEGYSKRAEEPKTQTEQSNKPFAINVASETLPTSTSVAEVDDIEEDDIHQFNLNSHHESVKLIPDSNSTFDRRNDGSFGFMQSNLMDSFAYPRKNSPPFRPIKQFFVGNNQKPYEQQNYIDRSSLEPAKVLFDAANVAQQYSNEAMPFGSKTGKQNYGNDRLDTKFEYSQNFNNTVGEHQSPNQEHSFRGDVNHNYLPVHDTNNLRQPLELIPPNQFNQNQQNSFYAKQFAHHSYPESTTEEIPVLKQTNEIAYDGSFHYETLTGDQTHIIQEGHIENQGTVNEEQVIHGSYSFLGSDGITYTVNYVADANGFRAIGDHLPTPPPVPEVIQRSIDVNMAADLNRASQFGSNVPNYSGEINAALNGPHFDETSRHFMLTTPRKNIQNFPKPLTKNNNENIKSPVNLGKEQVKFLDQNHDSSVHNAIKYEMPVRPWTYQMPQNFKTNIRVNQPQNENKLSIPNNSAPETVHNNQGNNNISPVSSSNPQNIMNDEKTMAFDIKNHNYQEHLHMNPFLNHDNQNIQVFNNNQQSNMQNNLNLNSNPTTKYQMPQTNDHLSVDQNPSNFNSNAIPNHQNRDFSFQNPLNNSVNDQFLFMESNHNLNHKNPSNNNQFTQTFQIPNESEQNQPNRQYLDSNSQRFEESENGFQESVNSPIFKNKNAIQINPNLPYGTKI